jgi:hypothetical protein
MQVKDHMREASMTLSKEHTDLEVLFESCNTNDGMFQIPRPFGFFEDYWTWAEAMGIDRSEDMGFPPQALYVMQRVWPVSPSISNKIRDLFFPASMKKKPVVPFLARLYLGRSSSRDISKFFSSENYPLDVSTLLSIKNGTHNVNLRMYRASMELQEVQ